MSRHNLYFSTRSEVMVFNCLSVDSLVFLNMRNIEIKAKVLHRLSLIKKAKAITTSTPTIIIQEDTFFNVPVGRFKLRKFQDGNGELIYYNRPDVEGPKLSNFEKTDISSELLPGIQNVLSTSLGVKTQVKKTRQLYMVDQTRVHVDSVENLGDFMELEVVLREDQSVEDGERIAFDLMEKLGVEKKHLVSGAYADLLQGLKS